MVGHQPANFGDHQHCPGGDTMFLVVDWQNSTYSSINMSLLFISKAHGLKPHGILS